MIQLLTVLALSALPRIIVAKNPAVCQKGGVAMLQRGAKVDALAGTTWTSLEQDMKLEEQHAEPTPESEVIHVAPLVALIDMASALNGTGESKSSSTLLGEPVCADSPANWTSSKGTPCAFYNKSGEHKSGAKWCDGGKPKGVLRKWLKLYADDNGVDATEACCICGGGIIIGPEGKVLDVGSTTSTATSANSSNTSAVNLSNATKEAKEYLADVLKQAHFTLKDLPNHSKMQHVSTTTMPAPSMQGGACSVVLVSFVPILSLAVSLSE